MKFTVIRPDELGPSELDRWHELQRAMPSMDNPFLSPEFALAVGRVLGRARVAVLQGTDGKIAGFLPFERHAHGVGTPIGAALRGGQGLVHVPDLDLTPHELLRGCGLTVWEFTDLLPGQELLARSHAVRSPCPVIDLSGGYEHWAQERRQRNKKLLKNLEAQARRFTRDHGPLRFTYEVSADDPSGHTDLRTLMRWKSGQFRRDGRADPFAEPELVRLVDELARTRTAACSGVLSMLYAGDTPVAGHFGLANDRWLASLHPGYDVHFGKYSPGLVLTLRMVEAGAAAGLREISLGAGDFDYKHRFKSHDVMVAEGYVQRPSAGAALRWVRREPVRRLTRIVTGNPRLHRAADATLKRIGRLRTRGGATAEPDSTAEPGT